MWHPLTCAQHTDTPAYPLFLLPHSLTRSLTHSLPDTCSLTDSLPDSVPHSLPHSLAHSLAHSLTHRPPPHRANGFETIMMNCNPETVSTDYDTSSRLYFEPITVEDVLNVIEVERPEGIIVQVGEGVGGGWGGEGGGGVDACECVCV